MDLTPSDDQRAIVESVRDFLTDRMPVATIRSLPHGDMAALGELWASFGEMGWFGLGLAEDDGGAGYALVDEALLFRELGRFLTPGPALATTLGARVAAAVGDSDLAARALSGAVQIGLGVSDRSAATPEGAARIGDKVRGAFTLVNATAAEFVLVADDEAAALVPAEACAERTAVVSLDEWSSRERCTIDAAATAHVTADRDAISRRGVVLTAAMLVGIAEATRDMATEHAKSREQFGQPIGAFQAIKHRCADMAAGAAVAEAQLLFAALSTDEDRPDATFQAASARIIAEQHALWNARENIQVHGGMGYTWECDAHLYLKRVDVLRDTFGTLRAHQRSLLAQPRAQ